MSRELYDSIVSKLATVAPMFAKSIVDAALEKHGLTPQTVSPGQMIRLIRDEIEPRIRKFTHRQESVLVLGAGVAATDESGRVLFIDPIARRLLALPLDVPMDDPVIADGLRALEMEHPGDRPVAPSVKEFYHESSARNLNVALAPRFDGEGTPSGTTAVIQDVTLRVALQEQVQRYEEDLARARLDLQERNRQLEEANRHKTEFLSRMSHELRTPLHCIIGYTQLAQQQRDTMDEEEIRQNLDTTITCAYDLLGIINEVLDLSRIESGVTSIEMQDVDVEKVVQEATAAAAALIGDKEIVFSTSLPDEPLVIWTDPRRLKQVLLNLLGNAVKFTKRGRIHVRVRRDGEDELSLRVEDTGMGIAPEQMDRIFESFYQVDGSTTRLHGGIGLGLTLVKHMVNLLGGRVDVQSEVGRGTVFTVMLPVQGG